MLKKIALTGVFALVSVVSLGSLNAGVEKSGSSLGSVGAPQTKGLNPCGSWYGCR